MTRACRNLAIATIMTMIAASPIFAVGTVNQVVSPIGRDPGTGADNRVHQIAINWTADASVGTVPVTVLNIGQFPAIQGMRLVSVEIKPGTPAPTNLYSITLTDAAGIDLLNGTGANLSNTTATSTTVTNLAAPLFGSLTFTLTGNSVNSATGSVFAYFAPLTQTTITTGAPTFTGANTFSGTNTFTGTTSVLNLNNVQYCDQFAGTTADVKITNCIAALPATGGVADARGIIGNQSFAATVVINKTITLLLGAVRITGPSSGDMIDVSTGTQGVIIRGIGSMQNTGATNGTVLVPVSSAQAHCISFAPSTQQYVVADLSITDSTAGGTTRTAGDGIRANANANPAQNSIGKVDNVYISFMFNGINLIRPITTTVNHATITQSKNDGFRAQGDGTSTWCTQCYSNHSGRHNYSFWGMNYSGTLEGASDNANGDGYRIDNCQNDGATCPGGNSQSLSMTISGGAELDCINGGATCAGVHILDAIGVELLGQKVLNSHGYGVWINGGRGVSAHGFVTGSTSNDLQVDCSGTPQCASGFLLNNLIYTTSGGGQLNSNGVIIGWTGGGGGANVLFAPAAAAGSDIGATGLPFANLWLGTAATNNFKFAPAATAAARTITIPDPLGNSTLPFLSLAQTWTAAQSFGSGDLLPSAAGGTDLGSTTFPFGNLWLGASSTSQFKFAPAATTAARTITIPDPGNNANLTLTPCFTSQKTETAADTNLLTCAIPAQAGSYRIRFVLSISAANAATLGWNTSYTDSNGNATASTNLPLFQHDNANSALTFTVSSASQMYGMQDIDVNNAGTSIVVKLTFSGTSFTAKATASVERII